MIIHLVEQAKTHIDPMKQFIEENYINRSKKVYNSYCEHLQNSLKIASIFGMGSIKMLIHAFIPDIFTTSTSECIQEINHKINYNKNKL